MLGTLIYFYHPQIKTGYQEQSNICEANNWLYTIEPGSEFFDDRKEMIFWLIKNSLWQIDCYM